jgi:hypothetical protein
MKHIQYRSSSQTAAALVSRHSPSAPGLPVLKRSRFGWTIKHPGSGGNEGLAKKTALTPKDL